MINDHYIKGIADKLRDMLKEAKPPYLKTMVKLEHLYKYVLEIDCEAIRRHLANTEISWSGRWPSLTIECMDIKFFNTKIRALAKMAEALGIYHECESFNDVANKLYTIIIDYNTITWKKGDMLKKYGAARKALNHIKSDSITAPIDARALQQKLGLLYHNLLDIIANNENEVSEWSENNYGGATIMMHVDNIWIDNWELTRFHDDAELANAMFYAVRKQIKQEERMDKFIKSFKETP